MLGTDACPNKPNYHDGSIVNLMSSIATAFGAETGYAALKLLPSSELAASNIVLMVLDGLGYQFLTTHGARSHFARHLRGPITSVFPTTTASAITAFLSGLAPQQHGLTGWFMHLKELGTVTAILPFEPRCGALPFSSVSIHASDIFQVKSMFERIQVPSYVVTHQRIVDSEFSLATTRCAERVAYEDMDGYFALIQKAIAVPAERKYVYAYWPEFDSLSHTYGAHSPQVIAHFERLDAAFGRLLESLAGTDTVVLVSADHGLLDTTPEKIVRLEHHPRLQKALSLPLCGEPRATYCYVHAGRQRQFEDYVSGELGEYCRMYTAEQAIAENFFGLGKPHPRLHDRIGDYMLLMKGNYVIKDQLPNEKPFSQVGVHGGLTDQELFVPVVMARV